MQLNHRRMKEKERHLERVAARAYKDHQTKQSSSTPMVLMDIDKDEDDNVQPRPSYASSSLKPKRRLTFPTVNDDDMIVRPLHQQRNKKRMFEEEEKEQKDETIVVERPQKKKSTKRLKMTK
jgi:hypothetical protein